MKILTIFDYTVSRKFEDEMKKFIQQNTYQSKNMNEQLNNFIKKQIELNNATRTKLMNNNFKLFYDDYHLSLIQTSTSNLFKYLNRYQLHKDDELRQSIISNLAKNDFRIGVISQNVEKEIYKHPKLSISNLSTKASSLSPSNSNNESFDILNEMRDTLSDIKAIFEKTEQTKNENINNTINHDSHDKKIPFYKNKMWYEEQAASQVFTLIWTTVIINSTDTFKHIDFEKMYQLFQMILKIIHPF